VAGVYLRGALASVEFVVHAEAQDMVAYFVFDVKWHTIHVYRNPRLFI
jgi:hypothetical protein